MFARKHRHKPQPEWILWGLPIGMVAIAGLLIASTQRQADYADWYHHWITAGVGVGVALILERLPLQRLKPFLIPVFGLTVASLVAVRPHWHNRPLAPNAGSALEGLHVQPSEFAKNCGDSVARCCALEASSGATG